MLEHERIPFVSYPYEWTFDMLRDAALLQLEIVERSLRHGWILKDATAYNVQFRGRDSRCSSTCFPSRRSAAGRALGRL